MNWNEDFIIQQHLDAMDATSIQHIANMSEAEIAEASPERQGRLRALKLAIAADPNIIENKMRGEVAKHPSGIVAEFENGVISIRIEWADADTFIELSDGFMAGVRAHYTDDLADACRLALEYWHSDHPNDTVEGMAARDKIVAALAKAEGGL